MSLTKIANMTPVDYHDELERAFQEEQQALQDLHQAEEAAESRGAWSGGLVGTALGAGTGSVFGFSSDMSRYSKKKGVAGALGGSLLGGIAGMTEGEDRARARLSRQQPNLENRAEQASHNHHKALMDFYRSMDALPEQEKQASLTKIASEADKKHEEAMQNYPTKSREEALKGVSVKEDKDGTYVYTHRCRSKSYPSLDKVPTKEIRFVESTG